MAYFPIDFLGDDGDLREPFRLIACELETSPAAWNVDGAWGADRAIYLWTANGGARIWANRSHLTRAKGDLPEGTLWHGISWDPGSFCTAIEFRAPRTGQFKAQVTVNTVLAPAGNPRVSIVKESGLGTWVVHAAADVTGACVATSVAFQGKLLHGDRLRFALSEAQHALPRQLLHVVIGVTAI